MQREIAFRTWHDETKRFYYMHLTEIIGLSRVLEIPPNSVIQQYTGLNDKNNIAIYEGDIIKEKHYDDLMDKDGYDYTGTVYWSPLAVGFRTLPIPNLSYLGNHLTNNDTLEIIGNIFETLSR